MVKKEDIMNNACFNVWSVKYDDKDLHIFLYHFSKPEEFLARRAKKIHQDATSFYQEKDGQRAIEAFMKSERFATIIADLVNSNRHGENRFEITCKEPVGFGIGEDGERFETRRVRFYLAFHGAEYKNRNTGMPFKVASFYPVREEN